MQQALLWSLYALVMAADARAMLISIGKYVHSSSEVKAVKQVKNFGSWLLQFGKSLGLHDRYDH